MAGELTAGRAFVDLVPRLDKSAAAAAEAQMGGVFGGLSGKAKLAGAAVGLGLAAGVAGVGAIGLAVGKSFDDAFDTIRTGTGKTGAALAGLEDSFRSVAGNVSNSFGQTSTAIAELSTRTGQTGSNLEGLATQILTLSRITGEDLSTTIQTQTRLFGDWGVAVTDQAKTLDYLYKVSQNTGVGVNDLSNTLVQFGAPLRQLGFSMEESAALIGKFEKEGVRTELVMGSMRIALGKMAKAGEPTVETLARVVDSIKGAGSASEANAIALELFGSRAGPDMAAAIREGRFEVDDLIATLNASDETILGAADATDDFGEKFSKLKNRIMVALEPLGEFTYELLNDLADALLPVVQWIGERLPGAFDRIGRAVGPVIDGIRQVYEVLVNRDFVGGGPFAEDSDFMRNLFAFRDFVVDKVLPVVAQLGEFFRNNLKPILIGLGAAFALLISPIGAVAAALIYAYTQSSTLRAIVQAVVGFLTTTVIPAIAAFVGYVIEQFSNLVTWTQTHWAAISEAVGHVVTVIRTIIEVFVAVVSALWSAFGDTILAVIETTWNTIRAVIELGLDVIRGIIEFVLAVINGDWSAAWDAIAGILRSVWDTIGTIVSGAIEVVKTFISDGLTAAKNIVIGVLDEIVGFFAGLGGRMIAAAGDLWGWVTSGLGSILDNVVDLFEDAVNAVIAVMNVAIRAYDALPFVSADTIDPVDWNPKRGPAPPPSNVGPFRQQSPEMGPFRIPQQAAGGTTVRPGLSWVGEDGPELLHMDRGATVIPLDIANAIGNVGPAGPAVVIQEATFSDEVDVDVLTHRVSFAMDAGRFG